MQDKFGDFNAVLWTVPELSKPLQMHRFPPEIIPIGSNPRL